MFNTVYLNAILDKQQPKINSFVQFKARSVLVCQPNSPAIHIREFLGSRHCW